MGSASVPSPFRSPTNSGSVRYAAIASRSFRSSSHRHRGRTITPVGCYRSSDSGSQHALADVSQDAAPLFLSCVFVEGFDRRGLDEFALNLRHLNLDAALPTR